jgi:sugar/nucleoside kinase (ribokinase family)
VDTPRSISTRSAPVISTETTLAEIAAAIELVAQHGARQVTLVALSRPEAVAAEALAIAQAAGVQFRLSRDPATELVSVVVGPTTE